MLVAKVAWTRLKIAETCTKAKYPIEKHEFSHKNQKAVTFPPHFWFQIK